MEAHSNRQFLMYFLFIFIGLIFLIKLFSLQVVNDEYKDAADANAIREEIIHPHRGLIYDRKGKLIVYNDPVYDLVVIPREVKMKDTLKFCTTLGITPAELFKKIKSFPQGYQEETLIPQLSKVQQAKLQDILMDYSGFYVIPKAIRIYPHKSMANALGYIGEINDKQLKADKLKEKYYKQGDLVGKSGLESQYEKYLRGRKGRKYFIKNNFNQQVGAFKGGTQDVKAIAGDQLVAGIDLELQKYAEQLMQHKKGGIVAIEPSTGEILSLVTAPSYDPNLLTGSNLSKNFFKLIKDEYKPLYNRAIQSRYPPGSTFKTVQALIGLNDCVLTKNYRYPCYKHLVKCHGHPNPTNAETSIRFSCNPFYYNAFKKYVYKDGTAFDSLSINYTLWRKRVMQFGFGRKLGVDIANEGSGSIPKIDFFNRAYGKGNWGYSNIYSLSIGQGEMGVTLLQLGNLAATIANRGYYYIPHLIKGIGKSGKPLPQYLEKHYIGIEEEYFTPIINGMEGAFKGGTVGRMAQMPYGSKIVVCAKTGTVQNPHGEDHSTFIAFAPKDNPKIAISVYVENAGFGGIWAANIASLMIEKYLTDTVTRKFVEKQVIAKAFTSREVLRRQAIFLKEKARKDSLDAIRRKEEEEEEKKNGKKKKNEDDK